jgi:hypothetical protein
VFGEGEWLLPITLKQDGITNTFGGVGMHKNARDYFDELDDTNGPRFFDFVEMSVSRPEHFPYLFARDVIAPSDEHTWEVSVSASGTQNVEMSWDPSGIALLAGELYLFDADMHAAIDMKKEHVYRFDPAQSKSFKILFGRDILNNVFSETPWLGQPYPNPSRGISYIPFALPGGSDQYAVKIEVFDMMGRHVSTVANDTYSAGAYTSQWMVDQSPLANGLYTVRMTVNDGTNQKVFGSKVLLNK